MLIDLTGQRFGRLVVEARAPNEGRGSAWACLCDCGKSSVVRSASLRGGLTASCGCLGIERRAAACKASNRRHGHTVGGQSTKTYGTWQNMLRRCRDPQSTGFQYYGAKGISVCDRWTSFENFIEDMGEAPIGKSLDRIDPRGNYEPGNCRWATNKQQANNKTNNRRIEFDGLSLTLSEWSDRLRIPLKRVSARLTAGWSDEKALTTPVDTRMASKRKRRDARDLFEESAA